MKEMTRAEFAKANLAALEEPISVRRYTESIGVYYPAGFAPGEFADPLPSLNLVLDEVQSQGVVAARERIGELEDEVARLKRESAARPPQAVPRPFALDAVAVTRNPRKTGDDPFVGLAKQDRDFFERKLGTPKKR